MVEHIELLKRDLKRFGQVRRKRETETHAGWSAWAKTETENRQGDILPGSISAHRLILFIESLQSGKKEGDDAVDWKQMSGEISFCLWVGRTEVEMRLEILRWGIKKRSLTGRKEKFEIEG